MKFGSSLSQGAVIVATAAVLGSTMVASGAVWSGPASAAYAIDTSSTSAFIRSTGPLAQEGQRSWGVPASVAMAQAILESGWGKSTLTSRGNAFFGIKCSTNNGPYATGCLDMKTREVFNGTPTYVIDGFRTYRDPGDSFKDHGRFLNVNRRYAKAFDYKDDPKRFIAEVHKAGYATDPKYTVLIVRLMDQFNLYRFDVPGEQSSTPTRTPPPMASRAPATPIATEAAPSPSPSVTPTPGATSSTARSAPGGTPAPSSSATPTPGGTPAPSSRVMSTPGGTPSPSPSATPSPGATPDTEISARTGAGAADNAPATPSSTGHTDSVTPSPADTSSNSAARGPAATASGAARGPASSLKDPASTRALREQDPEKVGALYPDGRRVQVAVVTSGAEQRTVERPLMRHGGLAKTGW